MNRIARDRRRGRPQVRPGLPADSTSAWTTAVVAWADHLTDVGKSSTTIDGYLKHVGWLAGDLAEEVPDPWELTPADLEDWLDRQQWGDATRSRVVVSLRGFYTWGVMEAHCRRSPLSGVTAVRTRDGLSNQMWPVPQPWVAPLAGFLEHLHAGGRAESTIRSRREQVSMLARAHRDPWAVTAADLSRWMARTDWSPSRKRDMRFSLRAFFSWAQEAGHRPDNPTETLPPVPQPRAVPRPTPDVAVTAALKAADDRIRLALLLALYAGLRRAEIARLHTRDIGPTGLRIVGKGGHERTVPIHPDLRLALQAELDRREEGTNLGTGWGRTIPPVDGWVFPSSTNPERPLNPRWMGTLMKRTLPAGWTPHTLRHRFASSAYLAARDLRAVQELLGHSSPETTTRYTAVPDGALHDAVDGITLPGALGRAASR